MVNCGYCKHDNEERVNFCGNCEKQIKCLNSDCGELLVANKTRCLVCGKPIYSHETSNKMNEFVLDEQQSAESRSRHIEARFTDKVASEVAPLLSGIPSKTNTVNIKTKVSPTIPLLSSKNVKPIKDKQSIQEENYTEQSSSETKEAESEKDIALEFFESEGESQLISKIKDYKGKSKKEQQQRFIILYAWAIYQIIRIYLPSSEHIHSAAKNLNLYDTNFSTNFQKTSKEFFYHTEAGYKLNTLGNNKVKEIIKDIKDSELEGLAYWKSKSKTIKKRHFINKENQQKIDNWLTRNTSVDHFDTRKLKSGIDLALFTLWLITKELKVADAVKPIEAFTFIKAKFKTLCVSQTAFSTALRRNPEKLSKTEEGLYFLTELGETEAKKLIHNLLENTSVNRNR